MRRLSSGVVWRALVAQASAPARIRLLEANNTLSLVVIQAVSGQASHVYSRLGRWTLVLIQGQPPPLTQALCLNASFIAALPRGSRHVGHNGHNGNDGRLEELFSKPSFTCMSCQLDRLSPLEEVKEASCMQQSQPPQQSLI